MIPIIDFDQIAVEMEMDPEDILHLMTIYQEELQKDLTELEVQQSQSSWLPMKEKLHKMKGDAANLYLLELAAVFTEMEAASQRKDAGALQDRFILVRQLQAGFVAAFEKYSTEAQQT